MSYIRLTDKERESVKREWYERIELGMRSVGKSRVVLRLVSG